MSDRAHDSLDLIDPTESGVIHTIEYDIRRALLAEPMLKFGSLVVRRVDGGVCLEGTLDTCPEIDIPALVLQETGVTVVANRLVVQELPVPPKG